MALLGVLRKSCVEERLPRVLRSLEALIVSDDIAGRERDVPLDYELEHVHSSSRYARMLARKRGIDPDVAGVLGAIHNLGRIVTGKQEGHAEAGYLPTKIFLRQTGLFAPDEVEKIANAVKNHSRKDVVGSPLEELVKDADIFDRYCSGLELTRTADLTRLTRIRKELNF